MPPVTHSVLGASSAKRWMSCPGSVRLAAGIPRRESEYAAEGTAAHELAERCLRNGEDASNYAGEQILVGDLAFDVTPEMVESVQLYLDTVRADLEYSGPHAAFLFEHSFNLDFLYPGLFGTNDACVGAPYGTLRVYDLKYGAGVAVDVKDNAQLKYYALGAAHGEDYAAVELVIVQPRARHKDGPVRRWLCNIDVLEQWGRDVLVPAARATEAPDAPLHAGEHCRFCPARAICPEIEKQALAVAQQAFGAPVREMTLPAPETMDREQIARVLWFVKTFSGWAEEVEKFAREELKQGREIPGWKMVEGRSSRRWKVEPAELEKTLPPDALYETKLRSVAQAEKALKAQLGKAFKAFKAETFDALVVSSKSLVLAAEHDARPAVNPQLLAAEAFALPAEEDF